jgi:hypothetical protein
MSFSKASSMHAVEPSDHSDNCVAYSAQRLLTENSVELVVLSGIPPSPTDVLLPISSRGQVTADPPKLPVIPNHALLSVYDSKRDKALPELPFSSTHIFTVAGHDILELVGIPHSPSEVNFSMQQLSNDQPTTEVKVEGLVRGLNASRKSGCIVERTMLLEILKQGPPPTASKLRLWKTVKSSLFRREPPF